MVKSTAKKSVPAKEVYQFYVELMDFEPKIWRRFYISSDMTMEKLAFTLMNMFNMEGGHIFNFEIDIRTQMEKKLLNQPDVNKEMMEAFIAKSVPKIIVESYIDEEMNAADDNYAINVLKQKPPRRHDASNTKIRDILYPYDDCIFTYDFGDNWRIKIVLEDTDAQTGLSKSELPRVKEGECLGIIEDCGGTGGLEEIVKAFSKKKGEEYKSFKEWLGIKDFDIHTFDIEKINSSFKSFIRYMTREYNQSRNEF